MSKYPAQEPGVHVQFEQPPPYPMSQPNAPPGPFPDPPPGSGYYPPNQAQYPMGGGYPPATAYPPAAVYPPGTNYPNTAYQQPGYPPNAFAQQGYGVSPTSTSNLPQYNSNVSDVSDTDQQAGLGNWTGFSDKAIRRAFIRKVYAILMLQLLFTVAMVALFVFQEDVKYFVKRNIGVYIAAYVAFIVIYLMLLCCGNLRRSYPTNYILLFLFTLVLSYLVATISSFHETKAVLIAMGICASCCLAITLFSFQTKYDFTQWGGILFVLSWVLLMFGLIAVLTFRTVPILHTVYAALGALLFMAFLAYDTQTLMGGKKYTISAEEHVFAALQLYMDVVNIFLFILALMGGGKK